MSGDTKDQDRREYFRVKNWMILNHQVIESLDDIPESDDFSLESSPRIKLLQQLSQLDSENQVYLNTLADKQNKVGGYLINLNKKIDFLTRFVLQSLDEEHQEMTEVDISGGGLRFLTNQNYKTGDLLKIELVLVPECVGIFAYGEVVESGEVSGEQLEIAVTFSKLTEADRDAIVKHVFKVQSQQLRHEKGNEITNTPTEQL